MGAPMKAGEIQSGSINSPTSCGDVSIGMTGARMRINRYLVEETCARSWFTAFDVMLCDNGNCK